jgi:hypothetical protein
MPRNRSRRWDIPSIIRVQDEDNVLTSSADLGRAVGWAKIQVRALNRFLRGPDNKKRLPYRTFHYAMPVKGVSRITIWTRPRDGTWFIRIIGGSSVFGNFIWIPKDGPDFTFPGRERDQILVKASNFGGPYTVEIKFPTQKSIADGTTPLVAGGIDWKGKTRTDEALGREVTDVLTWEGPGARYIQYGFASPLGREVYRNGVVYTDTRNLPDHKERTLSPVGDPVVGAAIQGTFGSPEGRRDVLVTRGETREFGGTQGIGFLNWDVWVRPENGAEGEFVPPNTGRPVPGAPIPNPNGWRHVAEIAAPDNVNPNRYGRMPIWFFNRSGTEASLMLPVQDSGIKPRRQRGFWATGTIPRDFPMELQLATLSIDAFAETATITYDAREPGVTGTQISSVNGDASGTVTAFCKGCPVGSRGGSLQTSRVWTFNGEVRRVAVDYKGDTRVFATMSVRPDAIEIFTQSSSFETNFFGGDPQPNEFGVPECQESDGEYSNEFTQIQGWDLRVGAAKMAYKYFDRTTFHDRSGQSSTMTDDSGLNNAGGLQWMDLRNDLIVYVSPSRVVASTVGAATSSNLGVTFYGDSLNTQEQIIGTKAVRGSATLVEYEARVKRAPRQTGAGFFRNPIDIGFFFNNFFTVETELITHGNVCQFSVPEDEKRTRVTTISTYSLRLTPSEATTERNSGWIKANKVSLESMQFDDTDTLAGRFGANSILMNSTHATDTAGNVALSIRTWEGRQAVEGFFPGPTWLNYIDGDDLIDVMNQVTYIDPGPNQALGDFDDFDLPPLDDTARADPAGSASSGTIYIL